MTAANVANRLQFEQIERFQRHLVRNGREVDKESAARIWIRKYAALWRKHTDRM